MKKTGTLKKTDRRRLINISHQILNDVRAVYSASLLRTQFMSQRLATLTRARARARVKEEI